MITENIPSAIAKIKELEKLGMTKRDISDKLKIPYSLVLKNTEKIWHRVVSDEIRAKIRQEVQNGKPKIQVSKELGVDYYNIKFHTRDIQKKKWRVVTNELKEKIRTDVKNGKRKFQVAKEYGISYDLVKYYTLDIPYKQETITNETIELIRSERGKGKTKHQIAKELKISCYMVQKYTKNMPIYHLGTIPIGRPKSITTEMKERILFEVINGKTKRQIADDLSIPYRRVLYFTKDLPRIKSNSISNEMKERIRSEVNNGKTKRQIADEYEIPYHMVIYNTKDLPTIKSNPISPETVKNIRREVKSGKSKMQVSREMNISPKLVYSRTMDILTGNPRNLGITGNSLKFFEQLMNEGYVTSSGKYNYDLYVGFRLKFPKIRLRRVKMFGIVIYFFQNNSNAAKRAFLEIWNRKNNRSKLNISGHKLQKINDVFAANSSKKDRKLIYSQQKK